jgi:hypothetical protein
MTHQAGEVWGSWCLVGIVAASMSTASGAILAMGTVFSHNLMRQLDAFIPNLVTDSNLVLAARLSTIPFAITSTLIAAYYKSGGSTGYLLIVAFDVVLATAVAPIFGAFYAKTPSPRAALCSILLGALTRITLEFALPKDGSLIFPRDEPEFQNYGPAASAKYPIFFDKVEADLWNPADEPCDSKRYEDYTGVDSLTAFGVSVITFCTIQWLEYRLNRPLFTFPGMQGYDKNANPKEDLVVESDTLEDTVKDGSQNASKHYQGINLPSEEKVVNDLEIEA